MVESQERRELILTRAAELFARKGVAATTVREIADAVGVLSGSLYHHFESKDAIVAEILNGYLDVIHARYAGVLASDRTAAQRLHDLVHESLRVAEEHPYPTAIYQNELPYLQAHAGLANVRKSASKVQRTWLQVIEAGAADGSFRKDIAPSVFYRLVRDAVWLSVRWYQPKVKYGTDQLADDITSIFLHGYGAEK